jgi:iron complex outermembrane receptor protein
VEGWAAWQAAASWRLSGGFVILDQDLTRDPGSTSNVIGEARDPSHQWMLRSSHNLGPRVELDLIVRRVAQLQSPTVPAYTALDAYLGWNITRSVTLAVAGQNLLDPEHPEFGAPPGRAEVPRSVFGRVTVRF